MLPAQHGIIPPHIVLEGVGDAARHPHILLLGSRCILAMRLLIGLLRTLHSFAWLVFP